MTSIMSSDRVGRCNGKKEATGEVTKKEKNLSSSGTGEKSRKGWPSPGEASRRKRDQIPQIDEQGRANFLQTSEKKMERTKR